MIPSCGELPPNGGFFIPGIPPKKIPETLRFRNHSNLPRIHVVVGKQKKFGFLRCSRIRFFRPESIQVADFFPMIHSTDAIRK